MERAKNVKTKQKMTYITYIIYNLFLEKLKRNILAYFNFPNKMLLDVTLVFFLNEINCGENGLWSEKLEI